MLKPSAADEGFASAAKDDMLRRSWPLLILLCLWTAIFAIPRSRDYVRSLYKPWQYITLIQEYNFYWEEAEAELLPRYDAILKRHPGDKRVEFLIANLGSEERVLQQLAELSRKYPHEPTFVAARLELLNQLIKHQRWDGALIAADAPGTPPPSSVLDPKQAAMLHELIGAARHGQRIDPENTFFDWFAMYGYFALRQDKKAMSVLAQTRSKTIYNSYLQQRYLWNHEAKELERWLSPMESTLDTMSASGFDFKKIYTADFIMEHVIAARQRRDPNNAIQSALDLLHLSRLSRQQSAGVLEYYRNLGIGGRAINSWQPVSATTGAGRGRGANLRVANNLAGYAACVGRMDAAKVALSEWAIRAHNRRVGKDMLNARWNTTRNRQLGIFRMIDLGSKWFLYSLTVVLPVGLLLRLTSRKRRIPEAIPVAWLDRTQIWGGFTGLACAMALLIADAVIAIRNNDAGAQNYWDWIWYSSGLHVAAPIWCYGFPIAVMALWCLWLARNWQRNQKRIVPWKEEAQTLGVASNPVNYWVGLIFPYLSWLSFWFLVVGALVYGFGFLDHYSFESHSTTYFGLWTAAIALVPLSSWLFWPRRRETLALCLTLLRNMFLGYVVTLGITYGIIILLLTPRFAAWDHEQHEFLRRGEMAYNRAELGLK